MARNLTDRLESAAGDPLSFVGEAFRPVGRWAFLLKEAFSTPRQYPKYRYNLFRQTVEIGLDSLPIVMLAAAFTGAVTTVQLDYQIDGPYESSASSTARTST